MSSEEFEKSLHSEIETYLSGRLGDVKAEVARLHSQLNEAFSSLLERAFQEQAAPTESAIAATIAEHLRSAHERGVELAAAESAKAQAASDVALLKAAIEDIDNQRSQAEILSVLVSRASSFAPRVAFFVVRNETAQGWRARGMEGTVGDDAVRQVTLSLNDEHAVGEAFRNHSVWSGAPGANSQDHILCNYFGHEPPQHCVALPLAVRNKVVAVLYTDSGELDSSAIKLEALEGLVRVTGMAVELLAVTRGAPRSAPEAEAAPEAKAETAPPAAQPEPEAEEISAVAPAVAATVAAVAVTETVAEAAPEPEAVAEATAAEMEAEALEAIAEAAPEPEVVAEAAPESAVAAETITEPEAISFVETAPEAVSFVETAPEPETVVEQAPVAEAAPQETYDYYRDAATPEMEAAAPENLADTMESAVVAETPQEMSFSLSEPPAPEVVSAPLPPVVFNQPPAYESYQSPPYIAEYPAPPAFEEQQEITVSTAFADETPTVETNVADAAPAYMPPMPEQIVAAEFAAPAPPPPDFVAEAPNVPEPSNYAAPMIDSVASGSWAMVESAVQAAPEPEPEAALPSAPEAPAFNLAETVISHNFTPPAPPAPEPFIPPAPPAPEPFAPVKAEEPAAPPVEAAPAPPPAYTAPLGSARAFGNAIDLPINVNDDERRLHTDARRFARLLVSEIKLYNEPKVQEGRESGNIYNLLRESIDRSRQMYDRRVAPPVASQFDYFHYELVNTLAEGDAGKLGQEYPGAAI